MSLSVHTFKRSFPEFSGEEIFRIVNAINTGAAVWPRSEIGQDVTFILGDSVRESFGQHFIAVWFSSEDTSTLAIDKHGNLEYHGS